MSAMAANLVGFAQARAAAVAKLRRAHQLEGSLSFCDGAGMVKTWVPVHAKLFDSMLCLFDFPNSDTARDVFLIEDAVVRPGDKVTGGMQRNKKIATSHVISVSRKASGRKIWLCAADARTLE